MAATAGLPRPTEIRIECSSSTCTCLCGLFHGRRGGTPEAGECPLITGPAPLQRRTASTGLLSSSAKSQTPVPALDAFRRRRMSAASSRVPLPRQTPSRRGCPRRASWPAESASGADLPGGTGESPRDSCATPARRVSRRQALATPATPQLHPAPPTNRPGPYPTHLPNPPG